MMSWIGEWWRRLCYLVNRRRVDAALQQEMADHRAMMGEPRRADRLLGPALVKDLHGARIDAAGFWMHRCPRVPLDHQRTDASVRQQHRRCQSNRTATDDQDRNFLHGALAVSRFI